MKFWDYCKDRAGVLLANAAGLLVLSVYLLLLNTTGTAVFLIDVVWISVLAVWLLVRWHFRRKYFQEIFDTLEGLDQRYLIAEVMRPAPGLEDRLYWEILRKSNKSVIEKIREMENSQREYKEYIESWIHEVKTPITAAHLICENHKDGYTRQIMTELDEIGNEVEKVLYYARMERVDRDYLIRPVSLRSIVLSAVRGEKRHLIRCGMQIDLDIDEDISVSTDEKWVEFILKQIFSNIMLNKLALRNVKRSMRDYLVYLITMIAVAVMMFAFNSLIFSKDIQEMCSEAMVLGAMLGMATFFIVLIVAWLINYMARFMLEKRSREFATYLLIGLKKKELSRLYMKENLLIGTVALIVGIGLGTLLQQIIMTVFYSIFSEDYHLRIQMNGWCLFMTVCCYYACYLFALRRNRKMFKKMTIAELLRMDRKNDEIKPGHEKIKQWLFLLAVAYILVVYVMMVRGCSVLMALILMAGFVAAVYLLSAGFSAFIVCRVQKKGKGMYRKERIFLYRQLSSKVRTMRFTMGTLTILLICALLGSSFALMFARYQNQAIDYGMPFDVIIHSSTPGDDFAEEISVIKSYNPILEQRTYQIYENGSQDMNRYYASHVSSVMEKHADGEGNFIPGREYYTYDTYMKLSDYNALRQMLGEKPVTLEEDEYALQTKSRIKKDFGEDIYSQQVQAGGKTLTLSAVYTAGFSQNGINGADYLIIVPDEICDGMQAYYSAYAADIEGEGTVELRDALDETHRHKHGLMTYDEYEAAWTAGEIGEDEWQDDTLEAGGTDEMIVMIADLFVRDADAAELKFVVTSVTFPLEYIALIFVFVAVTILAVQQLSDSGKYRFRYDVLKKLGMKRQEVDRVIFRQLAMFYLVPAVAAAVISSVIVIYAGNAFVRMTGAYGNGLYYFAISLLICAGVYVIYFAATYLGFKRNVESV